MRSVASVSFGKDSLAMLLLLLERKTRLDEVIFYNSGMEFESIYDIRDRIKPVLEQRGIRFTEVEPGAPFLYHMLERPVNSKKNGFHLGYGWCGGPCRWGTKLKTTTLDGFALDAEIHYVGIAVDEPERLERLESPKCSPLADAGMTEADCCRIAISGDSSGRRTVSGYTTFWTGYPAGAVKIKTAESLKIFINFSRNIGNA